MAAAKSKTPAGKKRAPGASSRSRSSAKAAGNDSKQESALFEGGSLAQRNTAEGTDPASDATGEITSSAPASTKEAGRASSPSGDEKPVGGKERDVATARKADPKSKVKPLPASEAKVGEGVDEERKLPESIDDLDVGSSVTKLVDEVQIVTPIAGGGRKVFHGRTSKEAFKSLQAFVQGDHDLLPGALGDDTDEAAEARDAQATQFDEEALKRSKKDLAARGIEAD
jgi:hypothetical protein